MPHVCVMQQLFGSRCRVYVAGVGWAAHLLPSTSKAYGPFTDSKMMGLPPTLLKARTGEFTPPGSRSFASLKIYRPQTHVSGQSQAAAASRWVVQHVAADLL